jgi:hypothetical protein
MGLLTLTAHVCPVEKMLDVRKGLWRFHMDNGHDQVDAPSAAKGVLTGKHSMGSGCSGIVIRPSSDGTYRRVGYFTTAPSSETKEASEYGPGVTTYWPFEQSAYIELTLK